MDALKTSYHSASSYPNNLICHFSRQNVLTSYTKLLNEKEDALFSKDTNEVDFWQCDYEGQGFWHKRINTKPELYQHLRIASVPRRHDPKSQFVFIQAPHSRDPLDVTRETMLAILSYHQVMPSFLDFVFSFGRQEYAEDFHFSGFRQESRLSPVDRGLRIPELKRSGRNIQLCYSLKSVEPTTAREKWSIRQAAFHHSFDLESGQASWIVIKGDENMRDRVMEETLAPNGSDLRSFNTMDQSFSSTLATHVLFCEWAAENWRWHINFLEEKVQKISRRTLVKTLDSHVPADATMTATTPPKPGTSSLKRSGTLIDSFARAMTFDRSNSRRSPEKRTSPVTTAPSSDDRPAPPELPPGLTEPKNATSVQPDEFSLDEVRRIQLYEERANEALLVLKTNTDVQEQLEAFYSSISAAEGFPPDIKDCCERDLAHFRVRIGSLQDYFRMQQARLETLLRLLADRKTLLYGILDYQNMQASKKLAEKGQESATSMERMTRQMHVIAVRTKKETVSMKIITMVTLFFLPGTFVSTLFSTDIIRYSVATPAAKDGRLYSWPALRLFLIITIPAMVLTFVAWGGMYWMARWREEKKAWKEDEDLEQNAGLSYSDEKDHAASEDEKEPRLHGSPMSNSGSNRSIRLTRHRWISWFPRIHLAGSGIET